MQGVQHNSNIQDLWETQWLFLFPKLKVIEHSILLSLNLIFYFNVVDIC